MRIKGIRRIRRIIAVLLTSATVAASLAAADRIEWEGVDGADHYRVEIRREGDLVLETRSDIPGLPLFLPPGEYEFKVEVMNAFGKVSSSSEWSPLRILAPVIPFIIDFSPRELHESEVFDFQSRVSGFEETDAESADEGTVFHLENNEGKLIPLDVEGFERDRDGEVVWEKVSLMPGRGKPGVGSWTLVMTNSDGQTSRMDDALLVMDRLHPRIRRFSPREVAAGKSHNPAVLEVTGMEMGAEIVIEGPSDIPSTLLENVENRNLQFSLNLENAEPGWYSVTMRNPSGGSNTKKRAFQVLPRPPTPEEIAAANALKIDETEPRPIPDFPHSISGSYIMNFSLGDTAKYFGSGFIGLGATYSQDFHNDLFRRLPGLQGLGWEASLLMSTARTLPMIVTTDALQFQVLVGVRYVTAFDFPVNLLVRAGTGLTLSTYTSPDVDRDTDIGGFTLEDLDSMDYLVKFGLGARYDVNPRVFIDFSLDLTGVFYLSRSAWFLQPRIEGGWRW